MHLLSLICIYEIYEEKFWCIENEWYDYYNITMCHFIDSFYSSI